MRKCLGSLTFTLSYVVLAVSFEARLAILDLKVRIRGTDARGVTTGRRLDLYLGYGVLIVIVQFVMTEGLPRHKPSTLGVIDRKYASYATSGLTVEIKPGGENIVQLEVNGLLTSQPADHHH